MKRRSFILPPEKWIRKRFPQNQCHGGFRKVAEQKEKKGTFSSGFSKSAHSRAKADSGFPFGTIPFLAFYSVRISSKAELFSLARRLIGLFFFEQNLKNSENEKRKETNCAPQKETEGPDGRADE